MIFYLLGKSGSGKDTILKELLKDTDLCLQPLILYTTRPIRPGETNAKEYYFISDEEAKALETSDRLIEMRAYNTAYGVWKYMSYDNIGVDTFERGVYRGVDSGNSSVSDDDSCERSELSTQNYITIGTLESYVKYVEYYGSENVIPIYIVADIEIRRARSYNRLLRRNFSEFSEKNGDLTVNGDCLSRQDIEEIDRRLRADEVDFSAENLERCNVNISFDNSHDLDRCVNMVKAYIKTRI